MHPVDLIRKKRDGGELSAEEIGFLVTGAARQAIPEDQLAAWLMAVEPAQALLEFLSSPSSKECFKSFGLE